jgi:hypothetical protein
MLEPLEVPDWPVVEPLPEDAATPAPPLLLEAAAAVVETEPLAAAPLDAEAPVVGACPAEDEAAAEVDVGTVIPEVDDAASIAPDEPHAVRIDAKRDTRREYFREDIGQHRARLGFC